MADNSDERRRIAVVGAGAIGSYYGAKLALAGSDVHFLMRSDLEAARRAGIEIRQRTGDVLRLSAPNCYGTTDEIGPVDLVLIGLKATANGELLKLIPPLLHEGTMLLTLQNGFGNEEFLAEYFGAERVLGGLCFICLNRVAPGVIEHYDVGRLLIGEYRRAPAPRTHSVVAEFARAVPCSIVENLELEHWRKLVWNIPFNGLSVAAGGVDTEALLRDPALHGAVLGLMTEVIDAANRCGFAIPDSEADEQVRRTTKLGAYKPSTLIDYEAGKPLEVHPIWGEPLRRAKAAGAAMPRLEQLHAILQMLDQRRRR